MTQKALVDQVLDDHLEFLKSELPHREFSRSWESRDNLRDEALKPGHFTLIYKGSRKHDDPYFASIELLIVGRIYCGARAPGLDVERAELLLEDEIRQYSEGSNGISLTVNSVSSSHQVEAPHGWVILECSSGPHDLYHSSLFADGQPFQGDVYTLTGGEGGLGNEDKYQKVEPDE